MLLRLIVSIAMLYVTAPAAAEHPPEAFASLPFMEKPALSPDGKRYAAKLSVGGKQYLGILNLLDDGTKPRLLNMGDVDVNDWTWVNDEWVLVWLGVAQPVENDRWYITRVLSVSTRTGKVNQLGWYDAGQNAGDVIWIARDGTPRIRLAKQTSIYSNLPGFWPSVFEFDVSTGRARRVLEGRRDVMSYYADGAGTIRVGYGFDDARQSAWLLYREKDASSFRTIARASHLREESVTIPRIFLPAPGAALVTSDAEGHDAVYRYDLLTRTRGERLFGLPGHDIEEVIPNPAGDGIAGVALTDDRPRIHWIDPVLAQVQADFDRVVGPGKARIVSWNRDQTKLLVLLGGADQAGGHYFYDVAVGRLQRIGWVSERLQNSLHNPVSTIRYKARDGLEISAVLTLPKGVSHKGLPLIVMPHGGPQVRDSEVWDWQAQFLASRGYAVVQPNYRGSAGFGAAFLDKAEGQWGLAMQDDLNDAVAHLAEKGVADRKRVCMIGGSYGGYAAMRAAERDGAHYRCAVSFAGVSDWASLLRYDQRALYAKSAKRHLTSGVPDLAAVSPINRPHAFSTPILLIHGKKDLRVPVAQSRRMAEKLKQAGKAYRYVEQAEGDHHFSREADRLQFLKEVEAFLRQYNPA